MARSLSSTGTSAFTFRPACISLQLAAACADRAGITRSVASPNIEPASRKLALDRCGWTPLWRASHSRRYDLPEEVAPDILSSATLAHPCTSPGQACLDKPGPGQDSGRLHTIIATVRRKLTCFAALTCVYDSPRVRLVQYSGYCIPLATGNRNRRPCGHRHAIARDVHATLPFRLHCLLDANSVSLTTPLAMIEISYPHFLWISLWMKRWKSR